MRWTQNNNLHHVFINTLSGK